ncbi:MAG: MFS transporter, partial [Acidobacteriaceae bacterium]|nr:MFS transporter [Acidobacteriaceae bacterium]
GSLRAGLRYVRYAPALQASLARALIFTFFVSAVWSLLAVVASQDLHQGAMGYGILNGSMGLGAVIGAFSLPRVRRSLSADAIIASSTGIFVMTLLVLVFIKSPAIIVVFLIAGGFGWTSTMSTLNTSVQLSSPAWVRARAIGAYQMIMQGGMALGGVTWGFIAEHASTRVSLASAAAGLLLSLPVALRFHVLRGGAQDLTPYKHLRPAPKFTLQHDPSEGPVRISIDYRIDPKDYNEFTRAIHCLRDVRMRDGAFRWAVFQDLADPGHISETFLLESWIEYLRQRERLTTSDREIREEVLRFHQGPEPPAVSHMIYAREISD